MVAERGHYFDQDLGEMMNLQMKKAYKKSFSESQSGVKFNKTEMSIAQLSCKGLTIGEIATTLRMSKRNVENYRATMQEKTGCANFQSVVINMFRHYMLLPEQF